VAALGRRGRRALGACYCPEPSEAGCRVGAGRGVEQVDAAVEATRVVSEDDMWCSIVSSSRRRSALASAKEGKGGRGKEASQLA